MTHGVHFFLLSLLGWEIIMNDLNHHIIDCPGVLATLLGADEHCSALVPTQPHHG